MPFNWNRCAPTSTGDGIRIARPQEQFNPLRIAQPLPLSAQQRGAIEAVSWAIHTRSGMCAHGARRRNNQRPATVHPRAMGQIERHLTSKEFRQRARLFITGYCRISIFGVTHGVSYACGFKLANDGQDTRAIQSFLGHKNIQHTVRYTELAPNRFKNFWRD